MKHTQLDKQTIAWFKIAECVSRGEKERALGVYRLLSYSFNDNAVARQLEADIYLSFNEQDAAISLYNQAIQLYQKSERFLEAAAVCEHLITMMPHDFLLRRNAVQFYAIMGIGSKIAHHIHYMIEHYAAKKQWEEIKNSMMTYAGFVDPIHQTTIYQQIIIALYNRAEASHIVTSCLEKSIDILLSTGNEKYMQDFLASIKALDDELYEYAVVCVQKFV
jgi:tetratricopeptide (TPR) repeat protein